MSSPNSPHYSSEPKPGKRPRNLVAEEDLEEDHAAPDLAAYFSEFGIHPVDQIGICRTYASYLATLVRTQAPANDDDKQKKKK